MIKAQVSLLPLWVDQIAMRCWMWSKIEKKKNENEAKKGEVAMVSGVGKVLFA